MRHVPLRVQLVARQVNATDMWVGERGGLASANDSPGTALRRPLVFAVGDADGNLHVYDLKRSRGRPEVTLKVTSRCS